MYRVLIADDEKVIQMGIKSILDDVFSNQLEVLIASNGEEALSLFKKEHPQVVITDVRMPVMDGLCLMRMVREQESEVAIIVLSGYDDFAYCKEALKNKAADYLLKPIAEVELVDAVQKALRRATEPTKLDDNSILMKASKSQIILDILEYVKLNYKNQISLEGIASHFCFNAGYLGRLFKKEMETNFVDYLNKVRIEKAKILLHTTRDSLNLIAEQVGYLDSKYFMKIFRKLEGITPGEYRNKR